jgi:hypothetical protein
MVEAMFHELIDTRKVISIPASRIGSVKDLQLGLQGIRMKNVANPDTQSRVLVTVAGTDPAFGGADLVISPQLFLKMLDLLMKRKHNVGPDRHHEPSGHIYTGPAQLLEFFGKHVQVDHHTVSYHAGGVRPEDPGGNEVKNVLLSVYHHGVTRIGPALAARDHIGLPAQDIHYFALALVTPLKS